MDIVNNERGVATVIVAIMIPVLVGVLGLAIDLGVVFARQRDAQTAADATAMAAAHELRKRNTYGFKALAMEDAERNGYDESNTKSIVINHPPASGRASGDSNFVEVMITHEVPTYFMRAFGDKATTIVTRAVAGLKPREMCVFATSPDESKAFSIVGTASFDFPECSLHVDSDAANAAHAAGGWVNSGGVTVVGNYAGGGFFPTPEAGAAAVGDPLADLVAPTVGSCTTTAKLVVNSEVNLSPGVYCGGIEIVGNGDATLSPGTYVLRGGGLTVGGPCATPTPGKGKSKSKSKSKSKGKGSSPPSPACEPANISGTGVTFFNTAAGPAPSACEDESTGKGKSKGKGKCKSKSKSKGSSGPSSPAYGAIRFIDNSTASLTAPTSGNMQGMLFFQDRKVTSNKDNEFSGNTEVSLTGFAYFPTTELQVDDAAKVTWRTMGIVAPTIELKKQASVKEVSRNKTLLPPLVYRAGLRE